MSVQEHDQPTIERVAREVAVALDDVGSINAYPFNYKGRFTGLSTNTYLSDHRTAARYFVLERNKWAESTHETITVQGSLDHRIQAALELFMTHGWDDPLFAIIELWRVVGSEEEQDGDCHYSHEHLTTPGLRCKSCGATGTRPETEEQGSMNPSTQGQLARWVAERVGDEVEMFPHNTYQILEHGNRLAVMWELFSDYLDDLNVAGRLRDIVLALPEDRYLDFHAKHDALTEFENSVWDDTPSAILALAEACGFESEQEKE